MACQRMYQATINGIPDTYSAIYKIRKQFLQQNIEYHRCHVTHIKSKENMEKDEQEAATKL